VRGGPARCQVRRRLSAESSMRRRMRLNAAPLRGAAAADVSMKDGSGVGSYSPQRCDGSSLLMRSGRGGAFEQMCTFAGGWA
jgi:hypothetical protein